jgi:iron complex transport system substrate-binding protein
MRVAALRWAFAAVLLAVGLPSACGAVEAVDDAGVTVRLPAPAVRIVSLAPHATELLYAAGAGDSVVGVLATSDWPPEALAKPRVGDSRALDLERILVLAPDLIVTWPFAAPAQVGASSTAASQSSSRTRDVDGIARDLDGWEPAGTLPTAAARAALFRAQLARLADRYRGTRTVRVF